MKDESEKRHYMVYTVDGITYLPHYQNQAKYVGPGYPKHNKKLFEPWELAAMGCKNKMEYLWKRTEFGKVKSNGSL